MAFRLTAEAREQPSPAVIRLRPLGTAQLTGSLVRPHCIPEVAHVPLEIAQDT